MCAFKDNTDVDIKKREYLKQQHQLRTMTKTNNALSADDMIENLLSKKEIFKMKKDPGPPQKNTQTNYPAWIYPGHEPPLYKRVWDVVVSPTGFADTPKLTSLLLTSRLPTDALGYIWSLSNVSLAPALSQLETYTSLALIALVQSGYSFTSVAVLNTLKEAPLPKLDYPLTEGLAMSHGPVMMVPSPTAVVPPVYSPVPPVIQSSSVNVLPSNPVSAQVIPTLPINSTAKTSELTFLPRIDSQSLAPSPSINTVTNDLSLLDLDLSLPSSALKSDAPKSVPAASKGSLLDKENSIDFTSDEITPDSQAKLSEKDIISEFSPTSSKNKNAKASLSFSTIVPSTKSIALVDDFFGDFQSVSALENNLTLNDEEEFDDFKSADFTPFTLLEVKEKPPEDDIVEKALPVQVEVMKGGDDRGGIEDLFPRCVVKGKEEENSDLLASSEDRYSALRGLTAAEDHDEFGDFLAATPASQPTPLPIPFSAVQVNIQEKAMTACLDLLEEAVKIFDSIDKEEVLNEVVTDPRGIQYLEELIEVERIALRLRSNLDKEDLKNRLQKVSHSLEQYLKPHRNSYMAEENGPKCGICLCERGPAYVKYGINNFHAPCANLYLHKVDSNLPIAPVM